MQQIPLVNVLSQSSTSFSKELSAENSQKDKRWLDFEQLIAEAVKTDDNGESVSEELSVSLSAIIQNILSFLDSKKDLDIGSDVLNMNSNSGEIDVKLEEVITEIKSATNSNQLLKQLTKLSDLIENNLTKPEIDSTTSPKMKEEFSKEIFNSLKSLLSSLEKGLESPKSAINSALNNSQNPPESDFAPSVEVVETIKNILNKIENKNNVEVQNNPKISNMVNDQNKTDNITTPQSNMDVTIQKISDDVKTTTSLADKNPTESELETVSVEIPDIEDTIKTAVSEHSSSEDIVKNVNMENTKYSIVENVETQSSWEVNTKDSVEKLIKLIEFVKQGDSKTLTVKLEPDFLGKMNIHLTDNAGKISAKIFVEHDSVKNFLLNNAESIRQQLADKGIHIDNMDFMFMGDHKDQDEYRQARSMLNIKSKGNIQPENIENKQFVNGGIYA